MIGIKVHSVGCFFLLQLQNVNMIKNEMKAIGWIKLEREKQKNASIQYSEQGEKRALCLKKEPPF